jgi:Tol biopolymer transport system component
MSPEQAMGEREITARSDVYALGAVTYEMLAGEPPFAGPTAQAIIARVITEEPRPLTAQRKSVPAHVDLAVRRALEKLPADRFGTAAEFAAALDERAASSALSAAVAPVGRERSRMTRLAPWAAAALALIGGLAAGRQLARPGGASIRFNQKTFNESVITLARFAPDGKSLVFSAAPLGQLPELFIIRPDYAEPQQIAGPGTPLLSVSSQGELAVLTNARWVVFETYVGTLARMPIGGGAPREMVDSVRAADWAPDGKDLAIIRGVGEKDRLEYPAGKVLVESAGWLSDPRFSPDGRSIAFAEHPFKWDDRGTINVVTLDGKRTVLSPDEYSKINGVAWTRDGEVLFSAYTPTAHQELILGVKPGGGVREVLAGAGSLVARDVAADGHWLVTREIFALQLMLRTPRDTAAREVGWLDFPFAPVLSSDGKLLAFGEASTESGVNYSVMMRSTDGGKAVRLGAGMPMEFSHDGRWVLTLVPSRPGRLVIYPTGAGTERTVNTAGLETIARAGWGPTEDSVWFCGAAAGAKNTCRMSAIASGASRPLEDVRLYSPDGTRMLVREGDRLMIRNVSGGTARELAVAKDEAALGWNGDGSAIYIKMPKRMRIDLLDVTTGSRRRVVDDPAADGNGTRPIRAVAVTSDGRVYLYQPQRQTSELFVVEGVR